MTLARRSPRAANSSETSTLTRSESPSPATFSRASIAARGDASSAITSASGRSDAIAQAIQPVPVPRSMASGRRASRGSRSSAHSARSSVSGRGTMASVVTLTVMCRNGWLPRMCCSGSRFMRRRNADTYQPASGASSVR